MEEYILESHHNFNFHSDVGSVQVAPVPVTSNFAVSCVPLQRLLDIQRINFYDVDHKSRCKNETLVS